VDAVLAELVTPSAPRSLEHAAPANKVITTFVVHQQAKVASRPAEERARAHAPRLTRERCRPLAAASRLDHGLDHRGPLWDDLRPSKLVKLSASAARSKTHGVFRQRSHGFNGVHGRMPSVATGAERSQQGPVTTSVSPATATRWRSASASSRIDPPQRQHAYCAEQRRRRRHQGPVLGAADIGHEVEEGRENRRRRWTRASLRCRSAARSSRAASRATGAARAADPGGPDAKGFAG